MSMEQIRPTPGKVLMTIDGFKYEGRIVIPEKAQRNAQTGTIVAVGAEVPEYLKVGQRICVAQFSGTAIGIKNHPAYRVITPDEVLLLLDPAIEVEEVSA